MSLINFNGIDGIVTETSPHGNYLVVQLSDNVYITGTFSNQFQWSEIPDLSSGFKSFITYFGFNNQSEFNKLGEFLSKTDGYCREGEDKRIAKRVKGFHSEAKIRNLMPDEVFNLIQEFKSFNHHLI